MYCVVLCKLDKTYLLRHIIYDVLTDSNISELKRNITKNIIKSIQMNFIYARIKLK